MNYWALLPIGLLLASFLFCILYGYVKNQLTTLDSHDKDKTE